VPYYELVMPIDRLLRVAHAGAVGTRVPGGNVAISTRDEHSP
jgi:hypothetical protein